MTPARPDRDTVQRRLRLIRETLDQLESLDGLTANELEADPLSRAAAERLLQVVIDLAIDVNAHLVVALENRAPETGRSSFIDLAACGILPDDLAAVLAPSAGMRNILVHHYIDIRPDIVAGAIGTTLEQFPDYIVAVAGFLEASA